MSEIEHFVAIRCNACARLIGNNSGFIEIERNGPIFSNHLGTKIYRSVRIKLCDACVDLVGVAVPELNDKSPAYIAGQSRLSEPMEK